MKSGRSLDVRGLSFTGSGQAMGINLCNLQYFQMVPQSQVNGPSDKDELISYLLEFGFDEAYVLRAANLTLDREKAAEILMKLVEQGPDADLSQYTQPVPAQSIVGMNQGSQGTGNKPNRAKMMFVVNGELKMGKGKICAQVGHAVIGAYLQIEETSKFDERSRLRLHSWENSGGAKIVVRANDFKQMKQVEKKLKDLDIGINTYLVEDAGYTQIEAGSKTVLGIGPAFSSEIDAITQHLKLL